MTTRDSYAPGTPNWVDLGSPDPAASAAFYSRLFGWTIEEGSEESGGYRMCMLRGRPVAGLGHQQGDGVWWTTYVSVDDADATAAAVEAAGGTVVLPPMDVLDAGRMAVFTDPGGAAFSVWQPNQHIGAGIVNEHGALTWNELNTSDVETAKRFYGAVFGWTFDAMPMPDGDYHTFNVGSDAVGGMTPFADDMPAEAPDHWLVLFHVDDVDAACSTVEAEGGSSILPPFDAPGVGRIAIVRDPHGAAFSLISPTAAA